MSGIGQYFHGEEGEVVALEWIAGEDSLTYTMKLSGDPHREAAQDYASDIGIDPALKAGDRAVYLRLSNYAGIWVKKGEEYYPAIDHALERIKKNMERIRAYGKRIEEGKKFPARDWLDKLAAETGVPARMRAPDEVVGINYHYEPPSRRSLFLSYSHRNMLIARQFSEDLRREAKSDVWIDLAHAVEVPLHKQEIEGWLKQAVDRAQVFVVLLTKSSAESKWVQAEMDWAADKAHTDKDFHLVLLNFEGVAVPPKILKQAHVIDCRDLSTGEVMEEMYAAIYKYRGRRRWLAEAGRPERAGTGDEIKVKPHLHAGGGVALSLEWKKRGNHIRWVLEYESDGARKRVEGGGEKQIVDFGIKPGQWIGSTAYSYNSIIWMRSDDLSVTPGDVAKAYYQKLRAPTLAVRLGNFLVALLGLLIIGAVVAFVVYRMSLPLEPPLPEYDLDFTTYRNSMFFTRALFIATVVASGMFQLVNAAHPRQFENKSGTEALSYMARAVAAVFMGAVVHPLVYSFGLAILYLFTAGILLFLLQWIFGGHWANVATHYGFLIIYAGLVIAILRNIWKLIAGLPDSLFRPEIYWV